MAVCQYAEAVCERLDLLLCMAATGRAGSDREKLRRASLARKNGQPRDATEAHRGHSWGSGHLSMGHKDLYGSLWS